MKNQMYITLLILPLLATGCGGRKETAQTMPVPEISDLPGLPKIPYIGGSTICTTRHKESTTG